VLEEFGNLPEAKGMGLEVKQYRRALFRKKRKQLAILF
jgi:hypothetical protein